MIKLADLKRNTMDVELDLKPGDLVWFEPGIGFPLPGEIQEVHDAAQIVIIAATIDGKVNWAKSIFDEQVPFRNVVSK